MTQSRRQLMQSSLAAATAASYSRILGANDRLTMGIIGAGPRGQYLMEEVNRAGGVQWSAVCDIYNVRRDKAASIAGGNVKTYGDHRQLLEHKEIDAVIVATPDHWHAPIAVDVCNAGKDVYVEKPMVHYPKDGQAIVKAVRANKRVLQVGMQARAVPHFQEARKQVVESGKIGKVGLVRTWYDANAGYIFTAPPGMETKPDGLDWDRWIGRGPKIPWNPGVYFSPYKWLHYDGGMIMGIGIHVIDSAHQFMHLSKPSAAMAGGGIYYHDDGRDTPDVVNLIIEYPQGLNVTFEAECISADMATRAGVRWSSAAGIELRGKGGVLTVHRYENKGWEYWPTPSSGNEQLRGPGFPSSAEWLIRNWFDCIRSREKPVANEEEGYWSSMACFLGNQAYRTKSRVVWNPEWDLPA